MEAPVPASALIHSATLVSAGIFLLLRFSVLFEFSFKCVALVSLIGAVTAFYGGFISMFQSDGKRVLAYSTISHCGYLMVMYTTGVLEYTVLYLYVHGFFKAATFLSVGNIIRFSRNTQDYKRMGFYFKFLPFDCFVTFICLINLSGLPLTFGFFIKHLLFVGLRSDSLFYYLISVNCIFGALTGLFYSSRLFYSVYFDFKKARKSIYSSANRNTLASKNYSNTVKAAT
jgi:NADH-quinone oxidoreductase subunit L